MMTMMDITGARRLHVRTCRFKYSWFMAVVFSFFEL